MDDQQSGGAASAGDGTSATLTCWRTAARWPLTVDVVTVGRSPTAEVRLLDDPLVSRLHARLERISGSWTVVDEGLSRNGTYVNGLRLAGRRVLHDGDELRLGSTMLTFCAAEDAEPVTLVIDAPLTAARLTPAQHAVLVSLCRPFAQGGHAAAPASNCQIADDLHVSVDTVKTHLRVLCTKLGLEHLPPGQKRLRLVDLAMRSGLVTLHELADRSP